MNRMNRRSLWFKFLSVLVTVVAVGLSATFLLRDLMVKDFIVFLETEMEDRVGWLTASLVGSFENNLDFLFRMTNQAAFLMNSNPDGNWNTWFVNNLVGGGGRSFSICNADDGKCSSGRVGDCGEVVIIGRSQKSAVFCGRYPGHETRGYFTCFEILGCCINLPIAVDKSARDATAQECHHTHRIPLEKALGHSLPEFWCAGVGIDVKEVDQPGRQGACQSCG